LSAPGELKCPKITHSLWRRAKKNKQLEIEEDIGMTEQSNIENLKANIMMFVDEVEKTVPDSETRGRIMLDVVQYFLQQYAPVLCAPTKTHTATVRCPHPPGVCGRRVTVTLSVNGSQRCPQCGGSVNVALS
jgi:hypothetical protein